MSATTAANPGRDRQGRGEARAEGGGRRSRPPWPRVDEADGPGDGDGQTTGRRRAHGLVDGHVAIDQERHGVSLPIPSRVESAPISVPTSQICA
jgi:hypothetical protein